MLKKAENSENFNFKLFAQDSKDLKGNFERSWSWMTAENYRKEKKNAKRIGSWKVLL